MAQYEIWLLDDSGNRLTLIDRFAFLSYTRLVAGFGTIQIGIPFDEFTAKVDPFFRPDWRLDVWRSPAYGYPMRREGIFLLRKPKIYTREEDGVTIIELYGRSPMDLLNRRYVIQPAGTSPTDKNDYIDDMMKAIVREQMVSGQALDQYGNPYAPRGFPADEFTVQKDFSLGPVISKTFHDRNVLDVLKELRETSIRMNEDTSTNEKVYFDVVARDLASFLLYILDETGATILDEHGEGLYDENSIVANVPLGFEFQTWAGLRGIDRSSSMEFSLENGNLKAPYYFIDHFEEVNSVYVKGKGRGRSAAAGFVEDQERIDSSRWNRSEGFKDASSATSELNDETISSEERGAISVAGRAELAKGRPQEEFYCTFLSLPGSEDVPRSLYGIDWDLGDLVRVSYAGMYKTAEIMVVYVSVNDDGQEEITGRSDIGEIV